MGKRKTKLLHYGFRDWLYSVTEGHTLKCMHSFPKKGLCAGKRPPEMHRALDLLFLLLDVPEIFLDGSPGSQNQRLELAKAIFEYPEFMASAIYTVFVVKPSTRALNRANEGALVRKFLLTQATVVLPKGYVSQVGATDNEIGKAVAKKYGLQKVPSLRTVIRARKELEQICGDSVTEFVDFCFKLDEKFGILDFVEQVTPKRRRSRARANYRKQMPESYYKRQ